jgi:hypothetical protein
MGRRVEESSDEQKQREDREKAEREEEAKLLGGCVAGRADVPARAESWSKQFSIYEQLSSGEKIPLGKDSLQYVDVGSSIVIERVSDTPKLIESTDGTRDERNGWDPVGLDMDVVIVGEDGCRRRVAVPGLQDIGGYDRAYLEPNCIKPVYPAYTRPEQIEKGVKFLIPPWTFSTGDSVQIQLEGRKIGEEETSVTLTSKSTIDVVADKALANPLVGSFKARLDGANSVIGKRSELRDVSVTSVRSICAKAFTVSFRTLDYGSIVPIEDRGGTPFRLVQLNGRSDNRNDVYFAFGGVSPQISDELFRDAVAMTATAIGSDKKTRDVGLAKNAGRPTLEHLGDDETIVIKLARKIQGDGGKQSEVPIKTYSFTAIAAGLHTQTSGDRKASYGTSSALFALLRHSDQQYGFAQTFSYTVTNKTVTPSFWDEFGVGVHVSVLARNKDDKSNNDEPLAIGLGGHVALGANTVHIGAGYDIINSGAYLLLGLSVSDLADFFKAQSSGTH